MPNNMKLQAKYGDDTIVIVIFYEAIQSQSHTGKVASEWLTLANSLAQCLAMTCVRKTGAKERHCEEKRSFDISAKRFLPKSFDEYVD